MRARLALLALAVVVLVGLRYTSSITPPPRPPERVGDRKLHELTVERLQSGVPYYVAVGGELRQHSYPTASVFNWRTPLHYQLLARLSVDRAALLFAILATIVFSTGTLAYGLHSRYRGVIAAISLFGAMLPAMLRGSGTVLFSEAWAGVAIALSVNAYIARRYEIGAMCGIAAVFLRELAAPYAFICGLLAGYHHRWREFSYWVVGGIAYAAYYAVHYFAASAAMQPGDLMHDESWLRLLGLPFVFKTLYVYGWLTILPAIFIPIAAAAGLAALAAPSSAVHTRAALVTYVLLFALVGHPFNFYWGYVTTGIWAHAFVHSGEGLSTLVRASRPTKSRAVPVAPVERVTVADMAPSRPHDHK